MTGRHLTAALALLLAAPAAVASWDPPASVPGTPNDVVASDGGVAAVGSTIGAYKVTGSAVGASPGMVNARTAVVLPGCLALMDDQGDLYADSAACFNGLNGLATGVGSVAQRFRIAPGGYAYACSAVGPASGTIGASPNGGTGAWTTLSSGACAPLMSAIRVGNDSYVAIGSNSTGAFTVLRNATSLGTRTLAVSTAAPPRSVSMTSDPGSGVRIYAVDVTGSIELATVDAGVSTFTVLPKPAGVKAFNSIALHQTATERFGLAIAEMNDGGVRVLSAVPDPNPAGFALDWRESTAPPAGFTGALAEVHCADPSSCAAITKQPGLLNVVTYSNAAAPSVPTVAPTTIPVGQSVTVPVMVSDMDGDAVWVTWTNLPPELTFQIADGGLAATVTANLGAPICDGGVPFTATLNASDGMAGHVTSGTANFEVVRTEPAAAPGFSPSMLSLAAGGAGSTVSVVPNDCANFTYAWQTNPGGGINVTPDMSTQSAVVTPPMHLCDPAGVNVAVAVTTQSPFGDSDAGTFVVHVDPWGPPLTPFAGDRAFTQDAGSAATYAREQTHVCDDGGTAVPLDTVWSLQGAAPPDVVFTPSLNNGVAVSHALTVESVNRCAQDALQFSVRNDLGDAGGPSASSVVTVQLVPSLDPVDAGTLVLTQPDPAVLAGELAISGINCPELRSLGARVDLRDVEAMSVVRSVDAGVPGPWVIEPPVTCSQRTYEVYAVLAEDESVRSASRTWVSPASSAALGELDAGVFVAECPAEEGEAAQGLVQGELVHTAGAATCDELSVEWSVAPAGGTPILVTGDAARASLGFAAWDDVLGRPLEVTAVGRAGAQTTPASTFSTSGVVPASTFVTARLETDAPIVSETGTVGIIATLRNESGCEVRDATWTFSLSGMNPVGEVARVADSTAPFRAEGHDVLIDHVAVPAWGETRIFLQARPTILGRPTPEGQLFLGGEAISERVGLGQTEEVASCACGVSAGETSSGLVAFALFALAFAARRSRARAPR